MASAKEIPPGGEGKIDITFKTGSGSSGKREKHITVTTNDPAQQIVNLTITTEVVEAIGISPDRINFNQVKKGKEHVRYASVTGDDKDKTKLTGSESPNPNIKVEINPKGYDDDKYRQIKVILLPTIRAGRFFDHVTIHTDHKEIKDIQLDVVGDVTGEVSVVPKQLHFGMFQKGRQVDRVISIRATEDAVFKVLEVKSTVPQVTTNLETIEAGREYRVHAQLKDDFPGDSLQGKLTIKTDLKEDPIIEIDIMGRKLPPTASQDGQESLPPFLRKGQQPPPSQQEEPANLPPFLRKGQQPPSQQEEPANLPPFLKKGQQQPSSPQTPPGAQPSGGPPPFLKKEPPPVPPPPANQ